MANVSYGGFGGEVSRDVLPLRLHHHAHTCADPERTRHFYEDIIGLPLRATWIEQTDALPEFPGRNVSYCHTFYGIGDGGALAFFNFADPDVAAKYKAQQQSSFVHIALLVTATVQERVKKRVTEAGLVAHEIDHGFCKSLYIQDPDGLLVEFTTESPDAEEIDLAQRKVAHETLRRWMGGDRTVNNDIRPETLRRWMEGETP